MKKVYVVGVGNAEGFGIHHICANEELALKRWEEIRQELITHTREAIEDECMFPKIYERMLKNLSETDPKKLDNYPFDTPVLVKHDLEE